MIISLCFLKTEKITESIFLITVAGTLGLINFTKEPESDLQGYYDIVKDSLTASLTNFDWALSLDPIFYFVTTVFARMTEGSGPLFILFWTTVTYYVAFVSVLKISKLLLINRFFTFLIILCVSFYSYGFILTGHLVRQYVGMSFLLFAFVMGLEGSRRSYLILTLSGLIHSSALIFAPCIYIANLKKINNKNYKYALLIMLVLAFFIGRNNVFEYLNFIPSEGFGYISEIGIRAEMYQNRSDGDVTFRSIMEYVVYTTACLYVFLRNPSFLGKKIVFFAIYYWCILIAARNTDLLVLRYSFYGFGVFSIVIAYVASSKLYSMRLFVGALAVIAFPRFIRSLENSNWNYLYGKYHAISFSIYDILN